jgi:hypothetical protein
MTVAVVWAMSVKVTFLCDAVTNWLCNSSFSSVSYSLPESNDIINASNSVVLGDRSGIKAVFNNFIRLKETKYCNSIPFHTRLCEMLRRNGM